MTKKIVLLQGLTSTPEELASVVGGLTNADLHWRPSDGEWSAVDSLSHLIDVEKRYLERLCRVVKEKNPILPAILPVDTSSDLDCELVEFVERFRQDRSLTIKFLRELESDDWKRTAVHETMGETDLPFLVQHLLDHDREHLNQIKSIERERKSGQ